jgi:Domain of unknown function (DU1801)
MQSQAGTVEQYLADLPADRRAAIAAVRQVILANLDKDYEEGMQYGMIGYYVPHRVYPPGYHCDPRQPLPFACLASQKNYMSLYLMTVYESGDTWFQREWAKTGKKLNMGKCCVRFKNLDELALDVIAKTIRRMPARKFVQQYESQLQTARKKPAKKRVSASRSPSSPSSRGTRRPK